MILAGDIGGTKTILALYEQQDSSWVCVKKETFPSSEFDTFSELLADFLKNEFNLDIQNICIGVAGPVDKGDCITTNLPWVLKSKEIAAQTGANNVTLLNDLESTAWGILDLPEQDFVELNPKAQKNIGNVAVIAAGTGLGEALIIWSDDKYHVVATEGGHTDYAPRNVQEIGLLQFLMSKFPEHVSYERVVCGQGLVNIYDYLKSIQFAQENSEVKSLIKEQDPAAVIGKKGGEGEDKLCVKALEMFCEIYGAAAGNLALKCLSKGGVVLAGGIAGKILTSLQKREFIRGFLAKGRYKSILQHFSVKVCLNSEASLIGAASFAKKMT